MDAAERTLVEEVVPELSGDTKYRVLMAASVLRISSRELRQSEALAQAQEEVARVAGVPGANFDIGDLVLRIRRGECDRHGELYQALFYAAIITTSVSNPAALTRVECDLAAVGEPDRDRA